jgi:hypothetical protein
MTDFERFSKALALTETHDLETAWGDAKSERAINVAARIGGVAQAVKCNFMAAGRWQIHPAWYHDFMPVKVPVDASWDEVFRLALENFHRVKTMFGDSPEIMAMEFHKGHRVTGGPDWDEKYAVRFADYYAQLGNPAAPAKGG